MTKTLENMHFRHHHSDQWKIFASVIWPKMEFVHVWLCLCSVLNVFVISSVLENIKVLIIYFFYNI